jgi:hypothetical protein
MSARTPAAASGGASTSAPAAASAAAAAAGAAPPTDREVALHMAVERGVAQLHGLLGVVNAALLAAANVGTDPAARAAELRGRYHALLAQLRETAGEAEALGGQQSAGGPAAAGAHGSPRRLRCRRALPVLPVSNRARPLSRR